jgi:hypothetical protein
MTKPRPSAQNGVRIGIEPCFKASQEPPNKGVRIPSATAKIKGPAAKLQLAANVTTAASAQLHRLPAKYQDTITVPGTIPNPIASTRSASAVDPTPLIPVAARTHAVPASPTA